MAYPIRSLTELHGPMVSILAAIVATFPSVTLFKYTMGVFPIKSDTCDAITGASDTALQMVAELLRAVMAPRRAEVLLKPRRTTTLVDCCDVMAWAVTPRGTLTAALIIVNPIRVHSCTNIDE
mmetsp:Transcript_6500/g.12888  ORF Transcript_6500/g.12888 Transcript_6500/m.12888 type:complete len:123 (-) Transcript_6500:1026-1394(-)